MSQLQRITVTFLILSFVQVGAPAAVAGIGERGPAIETASRQSTCFSQTEAPKMKWAVELTQISKRFESRKVLDGFDLTIAPGEKLVLLGPSGAGKTTLLRIIAGLEKQDAGSVAIEGCDMHRVAPSARGIAMLSQDYALYPQLSVRRNLEAALKKHKLSQAEAERHIAPILEKLGLQALQNQLPSQLSGGEAQRTALAKAIVARPKVLLLDEPLSQLDGLSKENLRNSILYVAEEFSQTTIMVTHDPIDAMRLADRVAVVMDGRVDALGTPAEIYDRPTSVASGNLLSPWGRMNWLGIASLPDHLGPIAPSENCNFVGFRPEKFRLEQPATRTSELCWDFNVKVQSVQHLGFSKLVVAEFNDRSIFAVVPNDYGLTMENLVGYVAADDLRFVAN